MHHTASPTNPRDPVSWVRKTYEYHVLGRGYSDVGYNFLIDHHGVIYEGRWARDYAPGELHDGESAGRPRRHRRPRAQPEHRQLRHLPDRRLHRRPADDGDDGQPHPAARLEVRPHHQIDPLGSDRYVSLTGEDLMFANICGHKDVGRHDLPGAVRLQQLPGDAPDDPPSGRMRSRPARSRTSHTAIRYNYSRPGPTPTKGAVTSASPSLIGYRILTDDGRVTPLGKAGKASSPRTRAPPTPSPWPRRQARTATSRSTAGAACSRSAAPSGTARCARARAPYRPVDLAATRRADGYWILASNGGVFAHGAAQWYGSLSSQSGRIVPRKIRATPTNKGYWILTANGRIYAFGDAVKAGSPIDRGRADVIDFAPTITGRGYWALLSGGMVMAFGDARKLGDLAGRRRPPTAIMAAPNGKGYYILTPDGAVTAFGKIASFGGVAARGRRAVAIAPVVV